MTKHDKRDQKSQEQEMGELAEIFFADLLRQHLSINDKYHHQRGTNHPDIRVEVSGEIINFEVTSITREDRRYEYRSLNAVKDKNILDEPKVAVTSKLIDKAAQYKTWIKRRIVKESDVNVIAIDLAGYTLSSLGRPILHAALTGKRDGFRYTADSGGLVTPLEGVLDHVKTKQDCSQIKIVTKEVIESLLDAKICAILTFTRNIIDTNNNYINVILLQESGILRCLFERISENYTRTTILTLSELTTDDRGS